MFVPQIPLIHEVHRRAADPDAAARGRRGRRRDRDARHTCGRGGNRRRSSSPVTATLPTRARTRTSRCSTTSRGVSDYVLYDEAGIVERTGVTPAQYPEYAALRGDPSDNLPGVPGIGEKTAAKLVNTYGNLEGIFEHLDDLPPKQRQNLGEARDRVFLNRQMSLLRRDCDLDVDPGDLRMGAWDRDEVRLLFDQLAFRTLLPRLLEAVGEPAAADSKRPRSTSRSRRPRRGACCARGAVTSATSRTRSSRAGTGTPPQPARRSPSPPTIGGHVRRRRAPPRPHGARGARRRWSPRWPPLSRTVPRS